MHEPGFFLLKIFQGLSGNGLGDPAGSYASRADAHAFCLTVYIYSYSLKIRDPASSGMVVGVTHVTACYRSLATYFAYFRHFVISSHAVDYLGVSVIYPVCQDQDETFIKCYQMLSKSHSI